MLNHITRPTARLYIWLFLVALFLGVSLALPLPAFAQDVTPPDTAPDLGATLVAVAFMALIANRITEGIAAPIREYYKGRGLTIDLWWLVYVSWVLGGVLVYFAGLNLFAEYFHNPVIGQLLTAVVVGGGGNMLDGVESWLRGMRGTPVIELSAELPAESLQHPPGSKRTR